MQTPDAVRVALERLDALGFDPETERVPLPREDNDSSGIDRTLPLFDVDEEGNIALYYVALDGYAMTALKEKSKHIKGHKPYKRTRWADPDAHGGAKYHTEYGSGAELYLTQRVVAAYRNKQTIHTLYITEGEFKAYMGAKQGLDIVGLQGISTINDKDTKRLFRDVVRIVKKCAVQNVVILFDADCNRTPRPEDLELDDEGRPRKDLRARPNSFYRAVLGLKEACKQFTGVDTYFMHPLHTLAAKGLDDVYVAAGDKAKDVTADALALVQARQYFACTLLTDKNALVIKGLFHCANAEQYYAHYGQYIGPGLWRWGSGHYQLGKDGLETIRHGEADKYIRVGNDYYLVTDIPQADGSVRRERLGREVGIITRDHGKKIFEDIPRYLKFVNLPNNMGDFREEIGGCYNMYQPCLHLRAPGEWPHTEQYLRHLFGGQEDDQYALALDYFTLMHRQPTQKLPILALVSEAQETGKSTLLDWLKMIYGDNVAGISSEAFASPFNSSWSGALVVALEEAKLDKAEFLNKLKELSTAKKVSMEAKGKDRVEIDFFAKFILFSNHETNFLHIDKNQRRFWVRRVPPLQVIDPMFLDKLEAEIPHWLHFLETRAIAYERKTRMWFEPADMATQALRRVQTNSRGFVANAVYEALRLYFLSWGEEVCRCTPLLLKRWIKESSDINAGTHQIAAVLKRDFNLEAEKNGTFRYCYAGSDGTLVEATGRGLYYSIPLTVLEAEDIAKWTALFGPRTPAQANSAPVAQPPQQLQLPPNGESAPF
jgi:hypothetical protein